MRESSTYQAILEEGRDVGRIEGLRRGVFALLRKRFGTVPAEVEARVRATTEEVKLEAALLRVLEISAPEELTL